MSEATSHEILAAAQAAVPTAVPGESEQALLLALARTRIDALAAADIGHRLAAGIDWNALLRLARWHELAPLLAFNVCDRFPHVCPAPVLQTLKTILQTNVARNLHLAQALAELAGYLQAQGVPVIAYKGPVLAQAVYGRLGLRSFADLDLLVRRWDYEFVVPDLLRARGWTLVEDYHFERDFRSADGSVRLDVHHEISPRRHLPVALDFDAAWTRKVDVEVGGAPVPTFSPEDLLIVLCVQLARDLADRRRAPPLLKVCDIAELVRSAPAPDWSELLRRARRLGVARIVCFGLRTAADVVGVLLPNEVWRTSEESGRLDPLLAHARERLLGGAQTPVSRPELLEQSRWFGALRERRRERSRLLRELFQHTLAPESADYAFVRLPRPLSPLYRAVRPIRVLCRVGSRLVS